VKGKSTKRRHISKRFNKYVRRSQFNINVHVAWRQLVLLVELMVCCIPSFFVDNAAIINPLGNAKLGVQ
jgi:hypothetical protein